MENISPSVETPFLHQPVHVFVATINAWIRACVVPHRYRNIRWVTTSNGYLRIISNSRTLTKSRFNNITINWPSARHKFFALNLIASTVSIMSRVHRCTFCITFFSPFRQTLNPNSSNHVLYPSYIRITIYNSYVGKQNVAVTQQVYKIEALVFYLA